MAGIMMSHLGTAVQASGGESLTLELGTITIGYVPLDFGMGPMDEYGFRPATIPNPIGSTAGPSGGAARINYFWHAIHFGGITRLKLVPGTYGAVTVSSNGLVNGSTNNISVTVSGLTAILESDDTSFGAGTDYDYRVLTDPFNLVGRVGMSVTVEITLA